MKHVTRLLTGFAKIGAVVVAIAAIIAPIGIAESLYGPEGGLVAAIALLGVVGAGSIVWLAYDIGSRHR